MDKLKLVRLRTNSVFNGVLIFLFSISSSSSISIIFNGLGVVECFVERFERGDVLTVLGINRYE